jgi:hypothetical protein
MSKFMMQTTDPVKLKNLMGYSRVSKVYEVLDRMQNDKEMRKSLVDNGLDFDSIAKVIKTEMYGAEKSADRLSAVKIALKIYGVGETKEDGATGGAGWEDLIEAKNIEDGEIMDDYEVNVPEIPAIARSQKEEEGKFSDGLYE